MFIVTIKWLLSHHDKEVHLHYIETRLSDGKLETLVAIAQLRPLSWGEFWCQLMHWLISLHVGRSQPDILYSYRNQGVNSAVSGQYARMLTGSGLCWRVGPHSILTYCPLNAKFTSWFLWEYKMSGWLRPHGVRLVHELTFEFPSG